MSVRRLLTGALVAAAIVPARAEAQNWLGWTMYWENDSFQELVNQSDEAYTNGVRVSVPRNPLRNWKWVDSFGRKWADSPFVRDSFVDPFTVPTVSFVLGQNFFTPVSIVDRDVDPRDRPYAGILYAGLRLDLTEKEDTLGGGVSLTFQHSMEGVAGVIGPKAFGDEVQAGVHALRTSRIPHGWRHQIGFDPLLQASYTVRARVGGRFLDVTPHVGAMVGNPQTVVYAGATARIGINLSGFPTLIIPMNVVGERDKRSPLELAFIAGFEGRAFAHNALLEGGLFGRDAFTVASKRVVTDVRLGAVLRLEDWRLSYTWMRRSEEIESGPFARLKHDYGSVAISYEPFGEPPSSRANTFLGRLFDDWLAKAFDDFILDAGVGTGTTRLTGSDSEKGIGMHAAIGRGVFRQRIFVAAELAGIGRKGAAPLPGQNHSDEFLRSNLLTVRIRPFPEEVTWGIVHLRAGVGRGHYKQQIVAPLEGRVTTCPPGTEREGGDMKRCFFRDDGSAVLLGGGWAFRLGRQISVGLDVSWNRIRLDRGNQSYFVPAFTMRYHPSG